MRYCKLLLVQLLLLLVAVAPAPADAYDPPAGFYNAATGQGATLKSQLTTIMSTGHILRTYGDFRFASALFDADPNQPGNILLVYNRASVNAAWDSGITWNREHVWPQSLQSGEASNNTTGSLGDHHALRPANPSINTSRGNKPFGNLDSSGTFGAQTGGTYYPGDADAGDIARSLFYSDTRYDSTLTDLSTGLVGDINTLIHWNYADPPDEFERRRNQTIFSSALNPSFFQNNRNAFIDRPELVWSIYGGGNNDSQLSVAGLANADGSSSTTVELGRVITGSAVPAAQSVDIIKTGADPTYYEVAASGAATSTVNGRFNAFVGGLGINSIQAGLNTSTATAGLKTGTIAIDNIDVSTGGAGQGSADANDTITVNLDVLDHANASFAAGSDQNLLTIDFGTLTPGGIVNAAFDLVNLESTLGFTADLDLDSVIGAGDTAVFANNLLAFSGLNAGASNGFFASFDTSAPGSFSATFTLNLSDEDIAGATNQVLTLQLIGEVVGALLGDLNGDGFVGIGDLNIVLGVWNQNVTPGDLLAGDPNGDGFVGIGDLNVVLGNWNVGTPPTGNANIPEPGTAMLLSFAVVGIVSKRRR